MTSGTTPLWSKYFDAQEIITPYEDKKIDRFQIYSAGPVESNSVIFVFFHGGGMSSMSFALVVDRLRKENKACIAFDYRGHGNTHTSDDTNLSAEQLRDDAIAILKHKFSNDINSKSFILIGHSLGGAVVVRVANEKCFNVVGVIVVDVVEGTALPALVHMPLVLKRRPKYFKTLEEAIRWGIRSGTIKNAGSAAASIPDQLVFNESSNAYYWRTDLLASEPYWRGWYVGLTEMFLSLPVAKVLVLAGVERLDKHMTVAQMQGKIQCEIMDAVGHVIHEDVPDRFTRMLIEFEKRNRFEEIAQLNAKWKKQ